MFWTNLVESSYEGQNGGNNGGNMMYNYGLDHGDLGEHFVVLTCTKHGIQMQHIVPYTPQQNGVSKRKNCTLKEMDNCMLHAKGLSELILVLSH